MTQPELPLDTRVTSAVTEREVTWFITLLTGRDWITAEELLEEVGLKVSDQAKRKLRALAEASGGQIAGGQRGYKLLRSMTHDDFQHVRNALLSQVAAMQRRVLAMDLIFYGRQPVNVSVGGAGRCPTPEILTP